MSEVKVALGFEVVEKGEIEEIEVGRNKVGVLVFNEIVLLDNKGLKLLIECMINETASCLFRS